jgi:hypothetical protein
MAAGVKHYFKDGKEHKGATHKDAKGRLMSGATHTASSKNLFHKKDVSATPKARLQSLGRLNHGCSRT